MTQTILITGASSGIGAAAAERFLRGGWKVGLMARRETPLAALAEGRDNAHVLPADVRDAGAVADGVARLVAATGRLDAVFANAGLFTPAAPFDEVPLDDWDLAVGVNLMGMVHTARTAFAQMRRQTPQGGRIILNGSISAHSPREGAGPYTVTKHAVTGLMKQIVLDGRPFDIACSQIDIGNARTDLLEEIAARAAADGHPAPPMIEVTHVADAAWRMAALPLPAHMQSMTLLAPKTPYIRRG